MIITYLVIFCLGGWFGLHARVTESAFNLYEVCIGSSVGRYILLGFLLILINRPIQMLDKSSFIFRYKDISQLLKKSMISILIRIFLLVTMFFSGCSLTAGLFSIDALLIPINVILLFMMFSSFIILCFVYVRNYSLIASSVLLLLGAIEVFSDSILFVKEIFDNYHVRALFYLPSWKSDFYIIWIIFILLTVLMFICSFYQYTKKYKLRGSIMMKKNRYNLIMLILFSIFNTVLKQKFIDNISFESSNSVMANMLFYWCNSIIVNLIWISLILVMVFTITDYVYSELSSFCVRYCNRKNMLISKMKEMIEITTLETLIVGIVVAVKGIDVMAFIEFFIFILFLSISIIMIAILLNNYIYSFVTVIGSAVIILIIETQIFKIYVFLNIFTLSLFGILSIIEMLIMYAVWTKKDVLGN